MKHILVADESKIIEMEVDDDLSIDVLDDGDLTLKLLNISSLNKLKITANVGKNSNLQVFFGDFSSLDFELESLVNLNEIGASCNWHLASLSSGDNNKKFDVSFIHNVGSTSALMSNYGVAKDKSKIVFSGVNHIKKGAKNSKTSQNAKIIVFDEKAKGIASPILRIDENDVIASHGAIVGSINDNHMFYLMSRGLSQKDARELITRGYLEPIKKHFNEANQKKIDMLLEETK